MAKLVFLLSAIFGLALAYDETSGTSLRRTFETDVSHRELSVFGGGWSWSNLLFQIGICHHVPAGCPGESQSYCPCPDCSKPLIPPHLHMYCKCIKSSSDGGTTCSTYDGTNSDSNAETYAGDGTSAGDNSELYDKTANQQGATRTTKLWAMILAGGTVAAAAAVGAVAYRKRQEAATETKAGLMTGDYVRSGTKAGIFAGALAAVGLSTRGGDTDSDDDKSTVSRRMQMMSSGAKVEDLGVASPRPSFVNVSAPMSGLSTSIYQSGESIEVEGPTRPSSSYGYAI